MMTVTLFIVKLPPRSFSALLDGIPRWRVVLVVEFGPLTYVEWAVNLSTTSVSYEAALASQ
jgi:hypothetical protein